MEGGANGWAVIARYLDLRGYKQCDLARILKLSPAAVTQIKKGESLLSSEQIVAIIQSLQISDQDITEFYTDIFNGRILLEGRGDYIVTRKQPRRQGYLPLREKNICCELPLLLEYEPVLESLESFISRRSGGRCVDGKLLLLLGQLAPVHGLPPNSSLLLDAKEYPAPDDLVLAAMQSGEFLLRRYVPAGDGRATLKCEYTTGENLLWQYSARPALVRWMSPVLEIVINLKTT